MSNAFTPPGGFGFGPPRLVVPDLRRHARREFREYLRNHGAGHEGPPPFGFGPAFEFPIDPRFGFGFGRGARRGRPHQGRGRRGRRGDVRAAILTLLAERPMHGYEMIQQIADRSENLWKPSPGSVYPTLQLLVDEGLIAATESSDAAGSKKLFELTDEGRAAAEQIETPPWEQIAEGWKEEAPGNPSLFNAASQLMGAVAQSAYTVSEEQQQRIVDIVNKARRDIYHILGES